MFEFLRTIKTKSKRTQTLFSVVVALVVTLVFAVPYFYVKYFYEKPILPDQVVVENPGNGFLASVAKPFVGGYESFSVFMQSIFKPGELNEYKQK